MIKGHFSRRAFLASSSAAAAAFTLGAAIPAVFAQPDARSAEKLLNWGLIGAGKRARVAHFPALKSFPEFQILGVCDVMEKHLAQGLKTAGEKAQGYADYHKLLANPDINAVMIATPNCFHSEIVVAALAAGKHVLCEKPMAVDFQQCKAMAAAEAAAPGRIVLYTMQLRYSPHYQELRKQIEAGRIGKPRHLVFSEHRGDWAAGDIWQYTDPATGRSMNWRYRHAASGGTLSEKVCHYFDILHWMVGALPTHVQCTGGIAVYNDGRDTWDHAATTLTYPDGIIATHDLCMFAPHRLDLQVIGDGGSIRALTDSLVFQPRSGGQPEEIKLPAETRHGERGPERGQETAVLRMYQDFIDCVKQIKRTWMDAQKAMASAKTAWLGELSCQRRQQVGWEEIA